jgi:hypothetical protein
MIACDYMQAMRYNVFTGVAKPCLIHALACKAVTGLGVAAVSDCDSWLHWKTYTGLQVSIRKTMGDYPEGIDSIFDAAVRSTVDFPASVVEAVQRAAAFYEDSAEGKQLSFAFSENRLVIRSANHLGWSEEAKEVAYSGPAITAKMNPKYVSNLIKHGLPCGITDNSMLVSGDAFCYALSITRKE